MTLDITGKIGIENVLELLKEAYTLGKVQGMDNEQFKKGWLEAIEYSISLVELNLPVQKK